MSIHRCPLYTQETCLLTYLIKMYEAQLLVIKAIPSIRKNRQVFLKDRRRSEPRYDRIQPVGLICRHLTIKSLNKIVLNILRQFKITTLNVINLQLSYQKDKAPRRIVDSFTESDSLIVYSTRNIQSIVFAKNTFYVKIFNNTMNIS